MAEKEKRKKKNKRKPTSNKVLRQKRLSVLGDIGPAIDLKGPRLVLRHAVRLKGRVPADLDASFPQVVNEEALDHALVDKQDVRIQDVDNGGVMDFAAQSVEGLVGSAAPKGDVVDANSAL